jgi:hypothetical protein
MINFHLPPYPYIKMLARTGHRAIDTYIDLWGLKNEFGIVRVEKKEIRHTFLKKKSSFDDDLLILVREALASVREDERYYHIDLTDWKEPDEE